MEIPKELTGEVKKFEDWIEPFLHLELGGNYVKDFDAVETMLEVRDFITKPFRPEMIEGYFEFDKSYGEAPKTVFIGKDTIDIGLSGNITFNNETGFVKRVIITLSDFIDACLNSGIKLRWSHND